ncbi:MAG TPA: Coenzyme F420 hydrogenase/dehydrogenase, beta subunit C-terminal domain [Spirochaetota bacterium]|nr:Coenzyme F420 hydrogenase/dehydrogenase, beta subunit C-terminal domain [Spirochaetota bacterium]
MTENMKYDFNDLTVKLGGSNMPLCNFCGTCIGICPTGALTSDYERGKPVFDESKCIKCGLCYRHCQGIGVDFAALDSSFKGGENYDKYFKSYNKCYLAHSSNDPVRMKGSSGGSVTTLLVYMLEKKLVDGVIIPRPKPDQQWLFRPEIVTDVKTVKSSAQSKYCLIPTNEILNSLKDKKGKYAIVALPCQIHSIRKLQNEGNKNAKKLEYLLALICGHDMEYGATMFGMNKLKIRKEDVVDIKYRDHGDWPGGLSFYLKNGEKKGINFFNYHYLNAVYLPNRCRLCPDYYGNYSDISFGDSWLERLLGRGMNEKGIPKGWSSIIAKTDKGLALLKAAEKGKAIHLEEIGTDEIHESFPFNISYKLNGIFIRLKFARKKPEYIGLEKPEKLDRYIYHFIYNIILVMGGSKAFRFILMLLPLNFNLFLIKNFKKLMGYKPNARDKVLKYNEKSNVDK